MWEQGSESRSRGNQNMPERFSRAETRERQVSQSAIHVLALVHCNEQPPSINARKLFEVRSVRKNRISILGCGICFFAPPAMSTIGIRRAPNMIPERFPKRVRIAQFVFRAFLQRLPREPEQTPKMRPEPEMREKNSFAFS